MPCTTILVGKGATYDGSTMIARTDDGSFEVKKLTVVNPEDQPRVYQSVISHLKIELPETPLRYTACPSVDQKRGIWAASGINAANVAMTATETTTSNPRILGADPLVFYQETKGDQPEVLGGIGEEDMVTLVLPYIHSAREGVLRLGSLLEQYGTYENNGIAFCDEDEIWWLDTIGGHHFLAKRVKDDTCVLMANQFGLDDFDFQDALGEQREHLCSADMISFLEENHLAIYRENQLDIRATFGSRCDQDHFYNTPRVWYMGRYLNSTDYMWEGTDADFGPESDDIPWAIVPEKKVTVEDITYLLSSHYQGTVFDPYSAHAQVPGIYRPIGINRTGVAMICQVRGYMPDAIKGVEWVCFGPTVFGAFLPVYTNVSQMPAYLAQVSTDVSTNNFYWNSRLLNALVDAQYADCVADSDRYRNHFADAAREILCRYDRKMQESGAYDLTEEANEALSAMAQEKTQKALNLVLRTVSEHMRARFSRKDN